MNTLLNEIISAEATIKMLQTVQSKTAARVIINNNFNHTV